MNTVHEAVKCPLEEKAEKILAVELPDPCPVYANCDEVREMITKYLRCGLPKTRFITYLKANYNSFARFMSQKGKSEGAGNGVFVAAWKFFEQKRLFEEQSKSERRLEQEKRWGKEGFPLRRDLGLRWLSDDDFGCDQFDIEAWKDKQNASGASIPEEASPTSVTMTRKAEKRKRTISPVDEEVANILAVELPEPCPVYANCDEIREMIREFLDTKGLPKSRFLTHLCVNTKSFASFMSYEGKGVGAYNGVYTAAWRFFERRRLLNHEPKSKRRLEQEQRWGVHGIPLEHDHGRRLVKADIEPNPDIWDIEKCRDKKNAWIASGLSLEAYCQASQTSLSGDDSRPSADIDGEIVGLWLNTHGRCCDVHTTCGRELCVGDVVTFREDTIIVDRKSETLVKVFLIRSGVATCTVGLTGSKLMTSKYRHCSIVGKMAQITEVYDVSAQYGTVLQVSNAPDNYKWTSVATSHSGQIVAGVAGNQSIFVSMDFGYNWAISFSSYLNWTGIACSGDGDIMYAVVYQGGIYKSQNSGLDWSPMTAPTALWFSITCSSSGQYIYAAAVDSKTYYSNNFGTSWHLSNIESTSVKLLATAIACSYSGQYVSVAVGSSFIFVSNDYGLTYNKTDSSVQDWYGIATNSSGQFMAAVAPHGNIFVSSDYGSTWIVTDAPYAFWKAICMSSSGQYIYALATDKPMYYSTDFGLTWYSITSTVPPNWNGIATSASGEFVYAVSLNNGIYSNFYKPTSQPSSSPTSNPTSTPSTEPSSSPTFYSVYSYSLVARYSVPENYHTISMSADGQYVYVGSDVGGNFRSQNYGNTWSNNNDINSYSVTTSANGSIVYTAGYYIYKSVNYGETWLLTSAPESYWYGLVCSETGQFVYAATYSVIYISHNGGLNWQKTSLNDSLIDFTDVACSANGEFVAAVSYSGNVFASSNYGLNFSLVLSDLYISYGVAMSYNGMYQMAISQTLGDGQLGAIVRSNDFGLTWNITTAPLGLWSSIAMSANGESVFAGRYEGSIYFSVNGGKNWQTIESPVGDWYGIAVSSDSVFLAAVSFDQGIYTNQYNIPSSLPTSQPSPVANKPHSSLPTSQPSTCPSSVPSVQPSSFPSYIPDSFNIPINILATDSTASVVVNNLGCNTQVFVWVTILVSYLDLQSFGAIRVTAGSGNFSRVIVTNCAPISLCGSIQCVANVNVTSLVSCSGGGSIELVSSTINVDQFTGVDTRCTFNGTTGLQYALQYSVSAFSLPTAQPTPAPVVDEGDFVFEASPDTPFYVIGLVSLLYTALGVVIVRTRDNTSKFAKLRLFSVCLDLASIGYHLASEIFYIIVVYADGLEGYAFSIVGIRLISLFPALYFLVSIFCPNKYSHIYAGQIETSHLFKNTSVYSLITMLSLLDQTLFRYMPWKSSAYTAVSGGFPDEVMLAVCMISRMMQLIATLAIQLIVLSITKSATTGNPISLALVLMYLISSVVTITLFIITNFVRMRLGKTRADDTVTVKMVTNPVISVDGTGEGRQMIRLSQQTENSAIVQSVSRLDELEEQCALLSDKVKEMTVYEERMLMKYNELSESNEQTQSRLRQLESLMLCLDK